MLAYPDKTGLNLVICGIDPGTRITGVCFLEINVLNFSYLGARFISIDSEHPVTQEKHSLFFSGVSRRLYSLSKQLSDLLYSYKPNDIAVETPFYNPRGPSAYGALSRCYNAIETASFNYSRYVRFFGYAPAECKKTLGINTRTTVKGLTTKDIVREFLERESLIGLNIDYDKLNEHELDALLVARTHAVVLKNNPYVIHEL